MYPIVGANGPQATLLSQAGRDLLSYLAGRDVSPDRALALSASLRGRYPAELVAAALTQQALRNAARAKFSRADQMLFTRSGLEQASSELTAGHAAARFAGASVIADLCCGIGGNLAALAGARTVPDPIIGADPADAAATRNAAARNAAGPADLTRRVVAVDTDPTALEFARHNASVCAPGSEAGFARADVRELPLAGFDAVFIDPARRDGQRRLPPGQYQPPLDWCLRLAGIIPLAAIKAAPRLARAPGPAGWG